MRAADREFEDALRLALHSAVDPIEPVGDGLAHIREQISRPWLRRRASLFASESVDLAWLAWVRCEPMAAWVRGWLAAATGPLQGPWRRVGVHGTHRAWLRPALAVAAVTAVVALGFYTLSPLRPAITSIGQITGGVGSSTGGAGGADSSGSSRDHVGGHHSTGSHGTSGHHSRGHGTTHVAGPSCPATPAPTGAATPTPTPSPSPSPTGTPTPTPTPSPTIPPTDSPSPLPSAVNSTIPFGASVTGIPSACPSPSTTTEIPGQPSPSGL